MEQPPDQFRESWLELSAFVTRHGKVLMDTVRDEGRGAAGGAGADWLAAKGLVHLRTAHMLHGSASTNLGQVRSAASSDRSIIFDLILWFSPAPSPRRLPGPGLHVRHHMLWGTPSEPNDSGRDCTFRCPQGNGHHGGTGAVMSSSPTKLHVSPSALRRSKRVCLCARLRSGDPLVLRPNTPVFNVLDTSCVSCTRLPGSAVWYACRVRLQGTARYRHDNSASTRFHMSSSLWARWRSPDQHQQVTQKTPVVLHVPQLPPS